MVILALIAIGAAAVAYELVQSRRQTQIASIYKQLHQAMDEDRPASYTQALTLGERVLRVDAKHTLTLSAMAYAEAVLANDHQVDGAQARAQAWLTRANAAPGEENEYRVAARALLAYLTHALDAGLAEIKAVQDRGGSTQLVELEAFRLADAARPDDKATAGQLRRLLAQATSLTRPLAFLGWYYYAQEDWARAGKLFDQALQSAKGHPQALLGRALVALEAPVAIDARQKDITRDIDEVFALPAAALSKPVCATAFFARGQLARRLGQGAAADAAYAEVDARDPNNAMLLYRRGVTILRGGDAHAAVALLKRALTLQPNAPRTLKRLAEASLRAGELAEAQAALERAAQADAKDPEVRLLQGQLALAQGDSARALASFASVTRDDGAVNFGEAQLATSRALRQGPDRAAAVRHMEGLMAALPPGMPTEMQARLWCELGLTYEVTHNRAKAAQSFQVGIDQNKFNAECHFFLCRTLSGEPEAAASCERYLALDPHGRFAAEAHALLP